MSGNGKHHDEDIAIVGMACLFPGAETLSEYWQNIVHRVDCVTDAPADWQPELFLDPTGTNKERVYTGRGGYLGDLCRFNPAKYGVMPHSVEGSEPDQFIALRVAHEALEDAGVPDIPINRERTCVILGRGTYMNRGYVTALQHGFFIDQTLNVARQLRPDLCDEQIRLLREALKRDIPPLSAETVPGVCSSVLVGRIANRLNLQGTAHTIDAACASSLLAIEAGLRELRSGRSDAAIVGGVQVTTPAIIDLLFCHLEALSRTGTISPLSADANGTLLGEGCGVIVLKRLSDAERDGNRIYVLLKGVGVSSDGRKGGLLAPAEEGQMLAIAQAYDETGVDKDSVELIEVHATGIPLGDNTEIRSLTGTLGGRIGDTPTVAIGSVKSMISHLIPAAGIASIIKTALALHHRTLPPTLHAAEPSLDLELGKTRFYVNSETRPWIHGDPNHRRRAAVDAFGFGGINAHAILEEHTPADPAEWEDLERHWPVELVVLSAPDRSALREKALGLARWVERAGGIDLIDVAAACAREDGGARLAVCAKDLSDLAAKLRRAAEKLMDENREQIQERAGIFYYDRPLAQTAKVAFVFPGEGAQYVGMLAGLYRHFPEVRRQFDLAEQAYRRADPTHRLSRAIFPLPDETERAEQSLYSMDWAIQSVTTADRALMALLESVSLQPDGVVGHSSGEFAALLSAGAVSFESDEQLIDSIFAGAQTTAKMLNSDTVPRAVLATVGGADLNIVRDVVSAYNGNLSIALDNCPHQLVLAGEANVIETALRALQRKGALCEKLPWDRAYHTEAYAPACEILDEYYSTLKFSPPRIEMWSCAIASTYPDDPAAVKELALRQWRTKVRFRETVQAMYEDGYRVFVEVGPRGNLSAFVSDSLAGKPHATIPLNLLRKDDLTQLCRALGMLAAHGAGIDIAALYKHRRPASVNLNAEPPEAPPRDPILKLEFPEFHLAADVLTQVGIGQERAPSAPPEQPALANPDLPREAAYADYQRTMREFLDLQERVMKSAFRAPASAPDTLQEPNVPETSPVSDLLPAGASRPPTQPQSATHIPTSAVSLEDDLLQIVSERTGYPTDMLALDADLEMDLGIDSIKRVEIIATFRKQVLPESHEPPAWFMEEMTSARTLSAILDGVQRLAQECSGAQGRAPVKETPTLPPLIDEVLELEDGVYLRALCHLDAVSDPFLLDHTFGRHLSDVDPDLKSLPVLALAVTVELMAQAAATLAPAESISSVRDVEALSWLAFDLPERTLRIEAKRSGSAVEVTVTEDGSDTAARHARATIMVGEPAGRLDPRDIAPEPGRSSRWRPEALYSEGLFHGPAFQAVRSIDSISPESATASLTVPDTPLWTDSRSGAATLPVALIDAVGQVLGFWCAEDGYDMCFPCGIDTLECTRNPLPGEHLSLALAITRSERGTIRSDADVLDSAGRVVLRCRGRSDQVLDIPSGIWRYRVDPHAVVFSEPVTDIFEGVRGVEHCVVTRLADDNGLILPRLAGIWSLLLSRYALNQEERAAYHTLTKPPHAVLHWLAGRVATKDAVRLLLARTCCMADIEVQLDDRGAPRISLPDTEVPPLISFSHAGQQAAAVAASNESIAFCGIDLEPVRTLDDSFISDAFAPEERDRICADAGNANGFFLSAWCAKEAVAKALGLGLRGNPRSLEIVGHDIERGTYAVRAVNEIDFATVPGGHGLTKEAGLEVHTREHDGYLYALCLLTR